MTVTPRGLAELLGALPGMLASAGIDPGAGASFAAALAVRLRVDAAQALSTEQLANAQANIGLAIGQNVQGYDPDLAAIAALDTTGFGRGLLTAADAAALRSALSLGVEDVGGIGALVIAASTALPASSAIAFGTTVAGSSLTTSAQAGPKSLGAIVFDDGSGVPNPGVNPGAGNEASLGLSGTWRLQTTMRTSTDSQPRPIGLWKRIA